MMIIRVEIKTYNQMNLQERKILDEVVVYVYGLFVIGNEEEFRYVGKTTDIARRFREHLADTSNTHKARWIQEILACDCKIGIKVLETLHSPTNEEWEFCEQFWIAYYKELEHP